MSDLSREDRERLQRMSVNEWERARSQRVDALAAAITHTRAALRALSGRQWAQHPPTADLAAALPELRARLAEEMADVDPFTRAATRDHVNDLADGIHKLMPHVTIEQARERAADLLNRHGLS